MTTLPKKIVVLAGMAVVLAAGCGYQERAGGIGLPPEKQPGRQFAEQPAQPGAGSAPANPMTGTTPDGMPSGPNPGGPDTPVSSEPGSMPEPPTDPGMPGGPGGPPPNPGPSPEGGPGPRPEPPTPRPAEGQTILRYTPTKGASAKYRMSLNMTVDLGGMMNTKGPIEVVYSVDQSVRITRADKSGFTSETTILSSKTDVKGEGGNMIKQMMADGNPKKGEKFTVDYDSLGKAKSDADKPNTSNLVDALGFNGVTFPQRPVRVGESWTNTLDLTAMGRGGPGMGMGLEPIPVTIRLQAIEGSGADRVGVFKITSSASPSTKGAPGNMKMSVSIDGTARINLASGLLVNSSATADTNMSLEMGQGGGGFKSKQSTRVETRRI